MSFLDKFRKGAQKAGIQATAFVQNSSVKVASGSKEFMQGFSLPGEAQKAARILASFLGVYYEDFCSFSTFQKRVYDKLTDKFVNFPWYP
jgi:hypothetical protein